MNPLPAIRQVDLFPIEHEGQTLICLSDPAGIIEDQLVLTLPAAFLAAQLDGRKTLEDMRGAFQRQFGGATVSQEELSGIVTQLDTAGFLQTESFDHLKDTVVSAFRNRETRPARGAGKSYPSEPGELREFLAGQFLREGAPGRPLPDRPGGGIPHPGLIVPHIDLHRGGHCYAHGYLSLYESGTPDTVIVYGVAHSAEPVPFIMTRKGFETPLGTLEADLEFIDALETACDFDPYAYEFTHRAEHSIEFQALMLAYLYGPKVKIVPILTSHFIEEPHRTNGEANPVSRFLGACAETIRSSSRKFTVLAAADLAHVGRRFGDPFDIDDQVVQSVRERDFEDLAFVHTIEPEAFYGSVMKDQNARHVCGYNCIYSAVKSLEGIAGRGETLHYGYAHDPAGGIVSFVSAALTE